MGTDGTRTAAVPPPPWRRGTDKPVRQQLGVPAIVAAAMRIMDREGLDAVSMRRVAQELGTGAASLYQHVRNKRELHELILDEVFRDLDVPEPDPTRWQQQLKDLCLDLTRIMLAHPGAAKIGMETLIPTTPGVLVGMDAMMGYMRVGGVPDHLIAKACDPLALMGTAFAYEASLWTTSAAGRAEAHRRIDEIEAYLDSLPHEQLPHLTALRKQIRDEDDGWANFELGIDIFIAGLATYATR
ncbi:MAG: TetR/AcrR family transcriptional regulator C-terminal domain-containing protein [Streptosporangiales bacterium]|nr:TetR/AcrR family transcriptional regulator C-terminal domain-containing protein [Streptosporangiales bacterium]MBO0892014.1 TetR/AcrR family transcriptional regulator C-terminal domain-containing protein [Acidothermales bacterium]